TAERGQYIFKGWYKDSNRTKLWDFDEDTVYDDITLYARWEYINPYQSVINALAEKIRAERDDEDLKVEILSMFSLEEKLCFVEKDKDGVYSYSTNIEMNEEVTDIDDLIPDIEYAELTLLKDYNDVYTSDNNALIADSLAFKFTKACNPNEAIIYSCVSDWEKDTEHIKNGETYYACKVRAIVADEAGRVYDYSFTVVAGLPSFNGMVLNQEFDVEYTELGEPARDFHIERLKELDVQY
ncbi:MAG: InlB B-repeat-containing protein, partial [Clostridia bacterium]|nr:InlB B-repeat-containing protein [Clostridia bacterium]